MATLVEDHSPVDAGALWVQFIDVDNNKDLTRPQREAAKQALLDGASSVGAAIAKAKEEVPTRSAGRPKGSTKSSTFKEVILPKKEYATVTSAINTNYNARFKGSRMKSIIVDMSDGAYAYTFEIMGFDDYRFVERRKLDD